MAEESCYNTIGYNEMEQWGDRSSKQELSANKKTSLENKGGLIKKEKILIEIL